MYTVRSVLPFLLFISGLCVYTMEPIGLARNVDFMQPADGSRYRTADYMTYLAQLVLGMFVTYWLQYRYKEGLSKLSCISAFEWITIISNVAGRVDKLVHDEVYICDGTEIPGIQRHCENDTNMKMSICKQIAWYWFLFSCQFWLKHTFINWSDLIALSHLIQHIFKRRNNKWPQPLCDDVMLFSALKRI